MSDFSETQVLSAPVRRPLCPCCVRPLTACLCDLVVPVDNRIEVLVLQHPLEAREAKNSVALLARGLARVRIEVGEIFDAPMLSDWLGPGARLLYPQTPMPSTSPQAVENTKFRLLAEAGAVTRLVVLDATWRKSLKMLHLNPLLMALPRLALQDLSPPRYRAMRRARRADQLSTLEAVCAALARLEQDAARYRPMLEGFEQFIARWQTRAAR
ncbi:MAG: hypothetical protein RLZZ592_1752 [Pseudomonadota bacterium]|jgi:DTW domain-containing protein YfiP